MAKKKFVVIYWSDLKDKLVKIGCNTYDEALIKQAQINKKNSRRARIEIKA